MVIMTAKLSKPKLLAIGLLIVLLVIVLIFCVKNADKAPESVPEETACASDIRTNEDRIAFLESYGWQVTAEPVKTQEVRIPDEPSDVFLRYNELQRSQGFDLTQLAGKTVKRYVYAVENYPGEDSGCYYASLLIYKNEVVGGDISSDAAGGVMHGFAMPD